MVINEDNDLESFDFDKDIRVRMAVNQDKEITLIKKKKKKNIIHEIYLHDRVLLKRFIKVASFPDTRQVWRMEDTALRRLSGLPVPKTDGFVQKEDNGVKEILYAREFIDGNPLVSFFEEDMVPLAWLMAKFHIRGVITRDPSIGNFIKTAGGNVLFIDFGRSVILNPKNPFFSLYLGKELARIRCHALGHDDNLYKQFYANYLNFMRPCPGERFLMEQMSSVWYKRFVGKQGATDSCNQKMDAA